MNICLTWPSRISINLQGLCSLDCGLLKCLHSLLLFISLSHAPCLMKVLQKVSTFHLSLLVSCFTLSTCLISLLCYVIIICCIWVESVVNHSYKPIILWPLQMFIFSRKHLFNQRNLIYSCYESIVRISTIIVFSADIQ